jgi:hypothetical protein
MLRYLFTYCVGCAIIFVLAYILTYKKYPEMTYDRLQMLLFAATTWPFYTVKLILGIFYKVLTSLSLYVGNIVAWLVDLADK